jgi:hypothetical protein
VLALVYVGAGQHYASRLRASGDEPHYLLMAQSLWREGDLDLADNLAREDFREYTPGPITPHYGARRRDGHPFAAHAPGLPALLAPVYALGGRRACVALLGLVAAGSVALLDGLARAALPDARARLVTLLCAAGAPLYFYSFHVYAEAPALLALLAVLRLLAAPATPAAAAAAGLLTGLLPWLHVRLLACVAVLALAGQFRLRSGPRRIHGLALLTTGLAYGAYHLVVLGTPVPLGLYGFSPVEAVRWPQAAAAGLLLDRSFGLLPYAPVFVLALAGLPAWARRRDSWLPAAGAVAALVPVLPWRMWWGGQCPPGRLLLPAIFALALAAGSRVQEGRQGLTRWWPALVAWGLGLAAFMTAEPGRLLMLNRADRPTRLWEALAGETSPGRYLPSLVSGGPAEWRVAALWIAALAAILVLDRLARRREAVDRLFRGLGLPLTLLAFIGLGVDLWARAGSVGEGRRLEDGLLGSLGQGLGRQQGEGQHLLDGRDEVDGQVLPDVLRDVFLDRLLVPLGEDDLLDPQAVRGQDLLLDPAHGQHAP